ncbi:MAG: PIG-L family deacetylase [bacterium]
MNAQLPLGQHVDILAIGTRPGDVEIGVGGILLKMAMRGYTTVICDLTSGGLQVPGNAGVTGEEIKEASAILHVSDRTNLDLGDFPFQANPECAQILADCLRLYNPDIILAPHWEDWIPLHHFTTQLLHRAVEIAGFPHEETPTKPYKPSWILYYPTARPIIPQIIVNITSSFEGKMEAAKVYQSLFHDNPPCAPHASTSSRDFSFHVESRARHFGSLINCRFGEGLILARPIPVDDICEMITL